MSYRKFAIIFYSVLLVISLLGCGPEIATPQPSDSTNSNSQPVPDTESTPTLETGSEAGVEFDQDDSGANLLVTVQGNILLRRINWTDFHPTAFGVSLRRGDLLKVPRGAQAVVLCDNLNAWTVPSGAAPSGLGGCLRPERSFLVRQGVSIISSRGGDLTAPYIISPRSTKLLSHTPLLRWNDSGAASYDIQVRGGELNWQQAEVTKTQWPYPGDPALEPGISYLLVVNDSNGKSSKDEGRVGLGFSLVSEKKAEEIRANAAQISGMGLSPEAQAFALAHFYASNDLVAEAIDILEALVAEGSEQASVHQMLADLYAQIGLYLLAETRYLEAITLAETQNHLGAMADIQANLGEIYIGFDNEDEAIRWLAQARGIYATLGDKEQEERVTDQLERLSILGKGINERNN